MHDCGGYFQRFVTNLLPLAGRFFPFESLALQFFALTPFIFLSLSASHHLLTNGQLLVVLFKGT
ncbi:hypothetical protein BKE17_00690 [Enhydrobacter sp. H5]|nr:hypothetical protein BKE17_00690 [Enhydrobacter sp. H5]